MIRLTGAGDHYSATISQFIDLIPSSSHKSGVVLEMLSWEVYGQENDKSGIVLIRWLRPNTI